jgi:hypothetical protein
MTVAFTENCAPKVNSAGIFLDILQTGCPATGGTCGFDVLGNKWQWCNGTQHPTLATLDYNVHFNEIKVNGSPTAWGPMTEFFP